MALLLMRPQGLTAGEAFDLDIIKDKQAFSNYLTRLEENWPFIIQPIGEKPTGYRPQKIYRITSIIDRKGKFRNIPL